MWYVARLKFEVKAAYSSLQTKCPRTHRASDAGPLGQPTFPPPALEHTLLRAPSDSPLAISLLQIDFSCIYATDKGTT